jgi:hypothetical protein
MKKLTAKNLHVSWVTYDPQRCKFVSAYTDLKNETELLREELEGKENTIHRVKVDHGQALHFSMEEKNREMDRLRHRLEDLQSQLELAEEAARSKEKVRVN